jgi:hypothetical protein
MIQKGHVLVKVCTHQYHLLHNLGQIIQRIHLLLILHHIKEPLIVQSTHKHTVAIRLIALIISQLDKHLRYILFHLPSANPTNLPTHLPSPLRSQVLLTRRLGSTHNRTVVICHKTLRAL